MPQSLFPRPLYTAVRLVLAGLFVWARITSYNVCYTKLLRFRERRGSITCARESTIV